MNEVEKLHRRAEIDEAEKPPNDRNQLSRVNSWRFETNEAGLVTRKPEQKKRNQRMDMILKTVLKSIEGEFILNIDGTEQSCKSSAAALDAIDPAVVYAIQKIGVKDGKVYIEVCDQTDEIAQQNATWMKAEKVKSGDEPSFF